ncbi:MAG: threonylcarbamoyl-AMP synthase [Chromatiales bacterium]|jgi:tRNA threonylcarbamoyl adenosine modification protein (Sua5/YciO/YrdC/YwlC family)|nr:MAG: threonylcarbamoyl-AMP synthase [Chromatiales bacterium]
MTQSFNVHPANPQRRLIQQAVEIIRRDGLIVYPTDSCYAFGWHLGDRDAAGRIQKIRQTGKDHNFTLVCRDLSEIATYARVENWCYRLLRAHTPGPYTFILKATREVPRRLQNPKRQTIGIRIPSHPVPLALLDLLGEPLMSSTLLLPGHDVPLSDPEVIAGELAGRVDLLIDSGGCGIEPTTVVDVTGDFPVIVRRGLGDSTAFE